MDVRNEACMYMFMVFYFNSKFDLVKDLCGLF